MNRKKQDALPAIRGKGAGMRSAVRPILWAVLVVPGILQAEEGPDPAVPVEQEAAASAPAAGIEYIPLRGFAFRTPDRLFELAVGFNLQLRFTRFEFDQVPHALEDANEFRVRRFKLYFTGHAFDPRLTYRMQLGLENVNTLRLLLDDAWLNYKFMDELAVQAGQSKTPYSREELHNDGTIEFTERASAVDAFKPGRDIGAGILGSLWKGQLTYMAGVFNGEGQSTLRASDHVMPMVRLAVNPVGQMGVGEPDLEGHATPALSFGVDGFTNTLRKIGDNLLESDVPNYASPVGWLGRNIGLFTTGENIFIESASADVQLKWMGLSVQGEYFAGHAEGDTSGVILRAYGWYGQAAYLVLPKTLDLAVRYSVVDANRAAPHDTNSVVTAATTWYIKRNNVKLQFDYSRTHRQRGSGAPANDQLFRVQVQLML
jgi:phosphate-selective porin